MTPEELKLLERDREQVVERRAGRIVFSDLDQRRANVEADDGTAASTLMLLVDEDYVVPSPAVLDSRRQPCYPAPSPMRCRPAGAVSLRPIVADFRREASIARGALDRFASSRRRQSDDSPDNEMTLTTNVRGDRWWR